MALRLSEIQTRPSVVQTHALSSFENDGSCWTCVARGIFCDKGLPGKRCYRQRLILDCQTCALGGYVCEGYATRLHWNTSAWDNKKSELDLPDHSLSSNPDFARKRRRSSAELPLTSQFPGLRSPCEYIANSRTAKCHTCQLCPGESDHRCFYNSSSTTIPSPFPCVLYPIYRG